MKFDGDVKQDVEAGMTDAEIAHQALAALDVELPLNWQQIQLVVHQGAVSLYGTVEWHYLRSGAASAVRGIKGVLSVRNYIKVKPKVTPVAIERRIADGFGAAPRSTPTGSTSKPMEAKSLC